MTRNAIVGLSVAAGAALLLFATIFFRVFPYMHGRSVTLALVGTGLGFLLDERRNATRPALAALALGTAIASHATTASSIEFLLNEPGLA